jgi:cobalt/nickel transport protein
LKQFLIAAACAVSIGFIVGSPAVAHFAMIVPSTDVVGNDDPKDVSLMLQFTHPFEGGPQMDLEKPEKFGVVVGDAVTDLTNTLREKRIEGRSAWETSYRITKPAHCIFFLHPKPYREQAEDKFILHFTKVIVNGFGAYEGWDKPIAKTTGLPAEIIPLSRPYSLYAGNIFTGQVFKEGKPLSDAEVEVELWGKGMSKAPTDSHVTQVVKTDVNGVFSYAMPKPGWWGFSAIMEGPDTIQRENQPKKVEIGAVIWVHAYPMQ